MRSVRKAAEAGWEFGGAPNTVIVAGLVMWFVLMEALRRTGGWSLLLSVFPFTVYPLFADAKWLGPFRGTQSTLEQATSYHVLSGEACSAFRSLRRHRDRLSGVRHSADDDRRGKILHQPFAMCGRSAAVRRSLHLRQRPARHDVRLDHLQRADRRHHDHSVMKKSGFRASYAAAIEACA
jgi:hypothetical protein